MLKSEEAVEGQASDGGAGGQYAEDATGLLHGAILPPRGNRAAEPPPSRRRAAAEPPSRRRAGRYARPSREERRVIDLHCHSTCSDGSETPGRVVELAAEAGLAAVALTDHDGLDGVEAAATRALELAIGFVPGCEVSCKFSPGTMHLLCYFVEPGDGPLQQQLVRLRRDRETRNERLVARLNELGIPITLEQVGRVAGTAGAGSTGGAIGRPHFARVLAEMGAVSSYQDAFDSLLAKGGPAYIPKAFVDAPTTIEAATGSGALAVLAHPFSLGLEPPELDRTVGELAAAGLTGVECWYGGYSKSERAWLLELAGRHGLVATGGSDFHGTFKADLFVGIGLGDLEVPDSALAALRARLA